MGKQLITVAKAAEKFKYSEAYLRQLAQSGAIRREFTHARHYLLDIRSVERFFAQPRKLGRPRKVPTASA